MAWGARSRAGDNVGVESGYRDTAFIELPVRPFLPLVSGLFSPRNAAIWGHKCTRRCPSARSEGVMSVARRLGHEASPGHEQGGIDGTRPLEGLAVDALA